MSKKLIYSIFLTIGFGFLLYFFYNEKENKIEKHLEFNTINTTTNYWALYKKYKTFANIVFESKVNTPQVINLFKKANKATIKEKQIIREKLMKLLSPTYEVLKKNNLKQLHFHFPNNVSFLRFHRPKKYGDNLSEVRESVKFVNSSKKPIDGFEEGRIYNGFRFVFPLFDENKNHIGSVETSFHSLVLYNEFLKDYNNISSFLVLKSAVESKVFKSELNNYTQSKFPKFLIEKTQKEIVKSHKQLYDVDFSKKEIEDIESNILKNKTFTIAVKDGSITYIPILNPITNKVVAVFIVFTEDEYMENKTKNFYIIVFLVTIIYITILFLINKKKGSFGMHKSDQKKLLILLGVIYISLSYGIFYFTENQKKARISVFLDKHIHSLETQLNMIKYEQESVAKDTYIYTISNKKAIDILKQASKTTNKEKLNNLREKLYNILKDRYQFMKQKGVFQYHFVLKNNTTFLRMHKTSKYGDDLTSARKDFAYVNYYKKTLKGFSAGKTSHGFRHIFPIFDENNNYICAVDISFSSESLQSIMNEVSYIHSHFLLSKHIFDIKAWDRDDMKLIYHISGENSEFMISINKQHTISRCVKNNKIKLEHIAKEIKEKMKQNKGFSLLNSYGQEEQIVSFYPVIDNISNQPIAWVVSYTKEPFIQTIKTNVIVTRTLVLSFSFLLVLFIYWIMLQRLNLKKEVKKQNKKLINTNQILQEQKKSFEAIFENAHDGIILLENDKIINCNQSILVMLKIEYKEKDIIGQNILELSSNNQNIKDIDIKEQWNAKLTDVIHHNSTSFNWVFKNTQKEDIDTEITLSKIVIGDKLIIHAIVRDVTEKLKQEKESLQKDMILIQQSKMASMGEMIGNIAHQWRQPLNALGLTIQKIKLYYDEDILTDEILTESVDKSKKLIRHMSSTIDDFRNFFKTDKVKHEFVVKDAITSTLDLLEASFKNNNINLTIKDNSNNIQYIGLKNELEQVLLNLLKNSKDALIDNKISNPKIDVIINEDEKNISIDVEDNAGGIPKDIIDKVFEPYFTTKEQGSGTGIGLYMSKMIIESNMNGTLSVKNKDNGACFTIFLVKDS